MENRGKVENQHYRRVRSLGKPVSSRASASRVADVRNLSGEIPYRRYFDQTIFNPVTEACRELGAVVERWIG
jgi:hypothetical protein